MRRPRASRSWPACGRRGATQTQRQHSLDNLKQLLLAVHFYHDAFNPNLAEVDDLKTRYRAGKVGDVEVKKKLAAALNAYLDPLRARRVKVLEKPETLREILHEGSRKARALAQETMARVRTGRRKTAKP